MQHRTGRRLAVAAVALAVAGSLSACGDARIKKITPGISRDSALKVINAGMPGDSLARVYKQETYLVKGKLVNVLFYNKDGIKQVTDSALAASDQTPIVTIGGTVTGAGWQHYDSVTKSMNISGSPHP